MLQWNRDTAGKLVRISIPQEPGCEVGLNCDQMEPPHEEQQSQQGVERNSMLIDLWGTTYTLHE